MTDPVKPKGPIKPIDMLLRVRPNPRKPEKATVECKAYPGQPTVDHYLLCINAMIDAIAVESGMTRTQVLDAVARMEASGEFTDHYKHQEGGHA